MLGNSAVGGRQGHDEQQGVSGLLTNGTLPEREVSKLNGCSVSFKIHVLTPVCVCRCVPAHLCVYGMSREKSRKLAAP